MSEGRLRERTAEPSAKVPVPRQEQTLEVVQDTRKNWCKVTRPIGWCPGGRDPARSARALL